MPNNKDGSNKKRILNIWSYSHIIYLSIIVFNFNKINYTIIYNRNYGFVDTDDSIWNDAIRLTTKAIQ